MKNYLPKYIRYFMIIALLMVGSASSAMAAELKLSPTSGSHKNGDSFNVTISLSLTSESVDGVDTILKFDSTKLSVTQINTDNGIFFDYPTKTYSNSDGTVNVSGLAKTTTPVTSGGTVAVVTFKVIGTGTAEVTFDYTSGSSVDSNVAQHQTGNDLLTSVTDATYTLTAGSGGTGGTTTTTTSPDLPQAGNSLPFIALLIGGGVLLTLGIAGKRWIKA
jgi:hypothetical protein